MQRTTYEIAIFLIVITLLVFVMVGFIISIIYLYRKKQKTYVQNLELIKHGHEKNLLQSQVEVQEQTFQNISREIHDNINLSLTLAKLQLNTLDFSDKNKTLHLVSSSIDLLSKSIKDLSDLSKSMNADIIAEEGLIEALEIETKRISKTGMLEIHTEVSGNPVFLDAQKDLIIFRIIQEAFNNVIKHASAKKVRLELYYSSAYMIITVKDNGKGFDPNESCNRKGAGLKNMKTRAKLFNGDVNIESSPETGTKVIISIPF